MFGRILFPTDFSPQAERVANCLPDLKRLGLDEVILLNVIEIGKPIGFDSDTLERIIDWKTDSEARMKSLREVLENAGIRVRVKIEPGVPHHNILRVAEDERVDLIVMGTNGHGFLRGLTVASVTHKVVQHAQVPTLVLKQKLIDQLVTVECEFICEHLLHRILLPTDFSATAETALQIVKGVRDAGGKSVVLLHVMTGGKKLQAAEFVHASERLEQIKRALEFFGFSVSVLVGTGDPFKEIERVTEEQGISLIVTGATGRSAAADVMLGSVADAVVCRQARPVLVVPRIL